MIDTVTMQPNEFPQPSVPVLVRRTQDGGWLAQALGWTDFQVKGATREDVLQKLEQLLSERLATAEIVHLEIPPVNQEHPLMKYAGMFNDDPQFDEVLAEIEAYRRELDTKRDEFAETAVDG